MNEGIVGSLQALDLAIIFGLFVFYIIVGLVVARFAGKSTENFFLSGRSQPWWLLGVGMVATTFSTDTPNLVTGFVRTGGVAGNWAWWAFLFTGMLTVFIYAKLWRRSEVMTDVEFYELRYSGKAAAFLRGFRAIYMGFFFNVIVMAGVTVAAIKIGRVMFGLNPMWTVILGGGITMLYSAGGGLSAVLWTDFVQFMIAMTGSIAAAIFALGHEKVGGLSNLLVHPNVAGKLSLFPDPSDMNVFIGIIIIPIAVQWWAAWYPGSEPGGGAYIAQRMLAAKNEKNAVGATMLFNFAHYAIRPWPWIIVALCSLVVFPDLASIHSAFPNVEANILKDDLGYPAMLVTVLPVGWLGLVTASLIAAYMSTVATHLNLGSSYLVNDFYMRFVKPTASEKEGVMVGRIMNVVLLIAISWISLKLDDAVQIFGLILEIGAGIGLVFLLRWFWWRVNAFSEISAMVAALVIFIFWRLNALEEAGTYQWVNLSGIEWIVLPVTVAIVTPIWLAVTFLTRPTDEKTLRTFYRKVKPGGPGWTALIARARAEGEPVDDGARGWDVPRGIICMLLGTVMVYSALFSTGYFIYQNAPVGIALAVLAVVSGGLLWSTARRLTYN